MGDLLDMFLRFGGAMAVLSGIVAGAFGWIKPGIFLLPLGLVSFLAGVIVGLRRKHP